MAELNLYFGWSWILIGLLAGAWVGIFFHDREWLGGYSSWPRRMVRLGHVSLVGTGLLNIAFAFTVARLGITPIPRASSLLFVVGGVTMPLVCFLAAWRDHFRHWFIVPVVALVVAAADILFQMLL
jgi:hypothetical protein